MESGQSASSKRESSAGYFTSRRVSSFRQRYGRCARGRPNSPHYDLLIAQHLFKPLTTRPKEISDDVRFPKITAFLSVFLALRFQTQPPSHAISESGADPCFTNPGQMRIHLRRYVRKMRHKPQPL